MQAHRNRGLLIEAADQHRDVLGEAVLVTKQRDLRVDGVRERHARAADELHAVMAVANVLLDVVRVDRDEPGVLVEIARQEAEQRGHEAARLRELKAGMRERRTRRLRVRNECGALDDLRADARDGTPHVEPDVGWQRERDCAADLLRETRRTRALCRHEQHAFAFAGRDQSREHRTLERLDRADEHRAVAVRDANSTAAPQLADCAIEPQSSAIAVDRSVRVASFTRHTNARITVSYRRFRQRPSPFMPAPARPATEEPLQQAAWRALLAAAAVARAATLGPETADALAFESAAVRIGAGGVRVPPGRAEANAWLSSGATG